MKKGVKGEICYPADNSYSVLLKDNSKAYLASTLGDYSSPVTVLGDPYLQQVETFGRIHTHEFVNVLFEGEIYRVLNTFHDSFESMVESVEFDRKTL